MNHHNNNNLISSPTTTSTTTNAEESQLALLPVPQQTAIVAHAPAPAPLIPTSEVGGPIQQDHAAAEASTTPHESATAAPRPPKAHTLQEALRWSLEARGGESASRPLQPLKEDDKQFLMNAMKSFESDGESLKEVIAHLHNPETPASTLCSILDGLQDFAEDIDSAIGLQNLRGLDACLKLIAHDHSEVQWRALQLLGHASQNNPSVQQHLASVNALSMLTAAFDSLDEVVQVKALGAVSCLIRGHDGMAHRFLTDSGPATLRTCFARTHRLGAKAFYLLKCLLQQRRDFADLLLASDTIDAMLQALLQANDDVWEQALSALVLCPRASFSSDHLSALSGLVELRRSHIGGLSGDEAHCMRSQTVLLSAIEKVLLQKK